MLVVNKAVRIRKKYPLLYIRDKVLERPPKKEDLMTLANHNKIDKLRAPQPKTQKIKKLRLHEIKNCETLRTESDNVDKRPNKKPSLKPSK